MKKALVTGATGGIGKMICRTLAKEGYGLYIHFHSKEKEAFAIAEELSSAFNVQCKAVQADLSVPNGPQVLLKQLSSPPEIIVYNCGSAHYGLLTDFTEESISKTMQLHLLSAITLTKSLIPNMIHEKKGKVIMISSVWGEVGASCETVYSAAKGGLNAFVKALSKELAPSGIQVNGIAPGVVDTEMLNDFTTSEKEELKNEIPAGRFGLPEEIAHGVEFLISQKANYISGHILSINGGWYT